MKHKASSVILMPLPVMLLFLLLHSDLAYAQHYTSLLNFHEYDLAQLYVTKYEEVGEKGFRIKKYKAIIQQGKKNDVEAIW